MKQPDDPDFDPGEVASPLSRRSQAAEGLRTLIETDGINGTAESVPGSASSLYPTGPKELPELAQLAREVAAMGAAQSSALGKSRALLVASQLFARAGDPVRAFETALVSAETSPKMALSAVNLRKKARAVQEPEAPKRALEAASRHATQASSRAHAIRLLVEALAEEGRISEVGQLLDQAARSGDADSALHLERLVHRLAQGSSLAGIELPEPLKSAVATAAEILSGAAKSSKDRASTPRELWPLQAARHLKANNPHETRAWLKGLDIPAEALEEFYSALLASEPGERANAKNVLKQLLNNAPSARVLRQLARLALEEDDRPALRAVLDRADPGSGTLSLKERWFLSACAGQPLEIEKSEMLTLFRDNEAFALALGSSEILAPEVSTASTSALLAQIGAGLTRTCLPDSKEPLSDLAEEALSELVERGTESEVTSALTLLLSTSRRNDRLFGQSLLELSREPNRAGGALIAAALLERVESLELAESGYRLALSGNEDLAACARRGLVDLGVSDSSLLLEEWAAGTRDPKLLLARRLLGAAQLPFPGAVTRSLDVVLEALDEEGVAAPSHEKLSAKPALLFALGSAAEQTGAFESAERSFLALLRADSSLSRLVELRTAWKEARSADSARSRAKTDPAERALAYWGDSVFPGQVEGSREDASSAAQAAPASEVLLHLARCIAQGELVGAAQLGSLCSEVDRTAGEIGIDTQKLAGITSELTPMWLDRARSAETREARRFAYERLAELDEQRGDRASALLWQKALAEEFPDYIPALLRLEETLLSQGTSTQSATEKLSQALPKADARTYRLLFGAGALADSDLRTARKYLEPLLDLELPPLLVLRGIITIAHEKRDDALLLRAYEKLAELPGTDLDRSERAHSRALLLSRLGRKEEAIGWARKAIAEKQRSFSAHQLLNSLNQPEDPLERAEQLEAFAQAAALPAHRAELFFDAGKAFDAAGDPERAADCYHRTLKASPDHREAFLLLCERRRALGDLDAVERLILSRLDLIAVGSAEHLELELSVAALLSTLERPEDAKKHLEAALSAHPTHSGALRSHADVSAQLGAHDAAEKSLLALRDRLSKGTERTEVMRSLARLYDEHLGQREKAMDAYQAVLEEAPDDERTRSDLVRIYSQLGLAERATVLQTRIIQEATTAEKKRDGALRLAEIYETVAADPKRAGATLERTRKAWPLDASVLEATVHFMDRQGTGGPRGFVLDRAGKDARRKLESGRLDAGLLDTLARVARLTDRLEQSKVTEAARHAYLGTTPPEPILGAGLAALSPKIDDIISPGGLSAPLRALLRKTGPAMDAAFSVDLANLGARPLTSGRTFERMQQIAQALDSEAPQLFVADRLGAKCLPITTQPARLLIGAEVDEVPEPERDYLLLRALKLRWLGAGALARSKDEDRFPMLVALLHLFAPTWRPANFDGRKAAQAKALIEQGLARVGYDDDVPMLALEVIGALGTQGAAVGDQPRILANRVALLGMGDPRIPISAMALTEGAKLAAGGPSRFRFIESHPEARDLLLFSTTEECAEAREVLGLGANPVPGASAPGHSAPGHSAPGQSAPGHSAPGHSAPLHDSVPQDGRPAPPRRPKPPPPRRP